MFSYFGFCGVSSIGFNFLIPASGLCPCHKARLAARFPRGWRPQTLAGEGGLTVDPI